MKLPVDPKKALQLLNKISQPDSQPEQPSNSQSENSNNQSELRLDAASETLEQEAAEQAQEEKAKQSVQERACEEEIDLLGEETEENGEKEESKELRQAEPQSVQRPVQAEKEESGPFLSSDAFVSEKEFEELQRKFYSKFREKLKEVGVDAAAFRQAAVKKNEEGISLAEAISKLRLVKDPKILFQIQKEIVEELKVPRVYAASSAGEVEVRPQGEDRVAFFYRGVPVIPTTYLPEVPAREVASGKFVLLLTEDAYSYLTTQKEIIRQSQSLSEEEIIRFEAIVSRALAENASDVHIVPNAAKDTFFTFFRIYGRLKRIPEFTMSVNQWEVFIRMLFKEISQYTVGQFKTDEFRIVQEGRVEYRDMGMTVRLEYIPDGYTLKYGEVVGRILKRQSLSISASLEEALGDAYFKEDVETFKELIKVQGALGIISGKTNSGKSTFLAKLISQIPEEKKVGTVEDPIEYVINKPNVVQHQLYEPKEGERLDFLAYVKAFKRADYDVVMIGEWRNSKGLTEAIVEQAQAGQLIFTTVHIKSAFEIYTALYDIFKVPYEISSRLIFFSLNQSLASRLCPKCKEEVEVRFTERDLYTLGALTEEEKEMLLSLRPFKGAKRGKGCPYCKGLGYKGMVPLYEFFIPDEEIKRRVMEEKHRFTPVDLKNYVLKNRFKEKGLARFKIDNFIRFLTMGEIEKDAVRLFGTA